MSASFSSAITSSAPLDTRVRCDVPVSNICCLSNTHCIARPGRPRNGVRNTGRFEPEIDARDRRRPGRGGRVAKRFDGRDVAREQVRQGVPRNGHHDSTGVETIAARLDVAHSSIVEVNSRGASDAHISPACLDESPRRLGIQLVERARRQRQRRVSRAGAQHLRQHRSERRRGGHAHRLIEGGKRERLPQHLSDARGLAVVDEPLVHRLAWRRGNARGRLPSAPRSLLSLRRADWTGEPQRRQPIAPRQRLPVEQAGREIQRRRQSGQAQPAALPDCDRRNRPRGSAARARDRPCLSAAETQRSRGNSRA